MKRIEFIVLGLAIFGLISFGGGSEDKEKKSDTRLKFEKTNHDYGEIAFGSDGICEFKDTMHLWGKGAAQTREIIKEVPGPDVRVLSTVPAGENMVSFAIIIAEDNFSRRFWINPG